MENYSKFKNMPWWIEAMLFLFVLFLTMFVQNQFYLSLTMIFTLLFYCILKKQLYFRIDTNSILFILFIFVSYGGLHYGLQTPDTTTQYVFTLVSFFIIYTVVNSMNKVSEKIIGIMKNISIVFLIGVFLQVFLPNVLQQINSVILTANQLESFNSFFDRNIIVGFSHNPAIPAFFISILIFYFLIKFYNTKNIFRKTFILILLSVLILLLFYTEKRGFLLFTLFISVIILFSLQKIKITVFIPILILLITAYIYLFNTEAGLSIIERTTRSEDITTGRLPVFTLMLDGFLERPVTGWGTFSILNKITLNHGHNIYLQILHDHGILGAIPFLAICVINLVKSFYLLIKFNSEKRSILLFSASIQLLFILWGLTGNPLYDLYPFIIYLLSLLILSDLMKETFVENIIIRNEGDVYHGSI